MKKLSVLFFCLGIAVCGTGCTFLNTTVFDETITQQYVNYPDQNKKVEGPGMARIYLCRPTSICKGVSFKVTDGDKHIGDIGQRGYLCWERKPGAVKVMSEPIGKEGDIGIVSFTALKGQVYYIQQYVWPMANNRLSQRDEVDGINMLKECSPPMH
jgi:hypothetical protein